MEKSDKYNRYRIKISDGTYQCLEANGEECSVFLPPDTSGNLPKLYMVKHSNDIYYVGITRQDIRTRLRIGFKAKGEHGYHGYKWKDLQEVELLVWNFPGSTDSHVEAIEAELVYFIREKTGHWPKYQMEIHFHGASEEERQVAKSILAELID
jgi:predicted GIY-YIG superfamily endonuclease